MPALVSQLRLEELLLELEPQIREIARAGGQLQGRVECRSKEGSSPGSQEPVTEADFWIQSQLLELLSATPLVDCQLLAEEWSPELDSLLQKFAPQADLQLVIDPLDGTYRFVQGLPFFATVVSLRQRERDLYTFCYYPKLDWWLRLLGEEHWEFSGAFPLDLSSLAQEPPAGEGQAWVVYTAGEMEDFQDWQRETSGSQWIRGDQLHPCGSKLLYLGGVASGYACARPNLYDGLIVRHYAKVRQHSLKDRLSWESYPVPQGGYLALQAAV